MKNRIIIAASLTLALTGQYATAGSIADTYTTGDALTAAKMDNIKAAVNGNNTVNGAQNIAIGANAADIGANAGDIGNNAANITANSGDTSALRAEFIDFVCPGPWGVYFGNRCYYLDGSGGVCAAGYELAPQSILTTIATSFVGKIPKTTTDGNCCIEHADRVAEGQDWGMGGGDCGSAGPYVTGPQLGAIGCIDANNLNVDQLTLCMSSR